MQMSRDGESRSHQGLPHRLCQVQAQRRTGSDRDGHQHAQELKHFQVLTRRSARVQDEAIAVGAGLVAAVRRQDQKRQAAVLQFFAHLGYALAVPAAAIVHTLSYVSNITNQSSGKCVLA